MSTTFKPKELAERYKVSVDKILGLIHSGQLAAFDMGSKPGSQRPRFRISEEAVKLFERARAVVPPAPKPRRRRRRRDTSIKEYF